MILRFTKGDGKPDTLTCVRDDGSVTFASSSVGTRHDLLHYAVETTLGCTEAFYGLVAAGRDIDDFGTRDGRRDSYPVEAIQVEFIVSMLQWSGGGDEVGLSDSELNEQLKVSCIDRGVPVPRVSAAEWAGIRERVVELMARWDGVAAGGVLELGFPGVHVG